MVSPLAVVAFCPVSYTLSTVGPPVSHYHNHSRPGSSSSNACTTMDHFAYQPPSQTLLGFQSHYLPHSGSTRSDDPVPPPLPSRSPQPRLARNRMQMNKPYTHQGCSHSSQSPSAISAARLVSLVNPSQIHAFCHDIYPPLNSLGTGASRLPWQTRFFSRHCSFQMQCR